jgi:glucose/arabinose dehydrogenase
VLTSGLLLLLEAAQAASARPRDLGVFETERARVRVDVIADSLEIPSAIAFLPDGRALVTERAGGRLTLIDPATGSRTAVVGMPPVFAETDGGTLDVVVHPDYQRKGWIYLAYSVRMAGGNTTVVDRARLRDGRLAGRERLFTARPAIDNANHFGCRLVLQDGFLFISLGDREKRALAQRLDTHWGKIVRVSEDGRVPPDNPFVGTPAALPEIWSLGHRNPQGLTLGADGSLWEHEHGPRGGDEINLIRRGANYGWPVVSFGREYEGGPVGEGLTAKPGMEPPLHYFIPSIAPSGMTFYSGDAFPEWKGHLFIGAMGLTHLGRYVFRADTLIREERLFDGMPWRVRAVTQGLDGLLYLGVDSGLLLRIRPEQLPPPRMPR